MLGKAVEAAEEAGDEALAERARLERMTVRMYIDPDFDLEDALAEGIEPSRSSRRHRTRLDWRTPG